jgi:acetoin utilization protein AcuB
MLMPTVSRYMTLHPHSVAPTDTMACAHDLMRVHGFRHLPVVERGRVVGIVTDRDLRLGPGSDPFALRVADAMLAPLVVIGPQTGLDEVLELMSTRRCDAVVVIGNEGLAGIFTASDALWALTDVLRRAAA